MARVPPTFVGADSAKVSSDNTYQESRISDKKVITLYLTNPLGTRKQRRYKQRHNPYFTKSRHKGREWATTLEDRLASIMQHSQSRVDPAFFAAHEHEDGESHG